MICCRRHWELSSYSESSSKLVGVELVSEGQVVCKTNVALDEDLGDGCRVERDESLGDLCKNGMRRRRPERRAFLGGGGPCAGRAGDAGLSCGFLGVERKTSGQASAPTAYLSNALCRRIRYSSSLSNPAALASASSLRDCASPFDIVSVGAKKRWLPNRSASLV